MAVPAAASSRRPPVRFAMRARFGRWGRALRKAGRAVADKFPLTLLGLLLVTVGLLAVRELGQRHQDVVLYVAGLGALAVVAVALVLVATTALVLRLRLRRRALGHVRLEATRPFETGYSLPALGWLPLVSLDWQWLAPEAVRVERVRRKGRFVEEATFFDRGEQERTVRRVVIEDVLGMARLAFTFAEHTPRTIVPALGRPLTTPLLEAYTGGDAISHPAGPPHGDLVDMRRYAHGDPVKRILWKVYARSRTLMVRLPERAISPTQRMLAYLVAGEGDEAAAALARLAVESGALGPDWRFGADQPEGQAEEDTDDPARALALIVASRGARARGGAGLGSFLERAERDGRCVVFASARAGGWLAAVEEAARRRAGRIEVVLGVDGVRHEGRADRWRKLFLMERHDGEMDAVGARPRADELDALVRRLVAAGAVVTVVDRPTGKVYARSARRRLA